jgi:hypothetical protein
MEGGVVGTEILKNKENQKEWIQVTGKSFLETSLPN